MMEKRLTLKHQRSHSFESAALEGNKKTSRASSFKTLFRSSKRLKNLENFIVIEENNNQKLSVAFTLTSSCDLIGKRPELRTGSIHDCSVAGVGAANGGLEAPLLQADRLSPLVTSTTDFPTKILLPPEHFRFSDTTVDAYLRSTNESQNGGRSLSASSISSTRNSNDHTSESKKIRPIARRSISPRHSPVSLQLREKRSSRERELNGVAANNGNGGGIGRSIKNFLAPNYKYREEQFRRLFDVPETDQFVVDYSCAFQREILAQGRLFVSQAHVSFYANIFSWETRFIVAFKDVARITKERTAKVIPNAIQIETAGGEKLFFATFTSRDKSFLMIRKLWQLALNNKAVTPQEMWDWAEQGYQEHDLNASDDEEIRSFTCSSAYSAQETSSGFAEDSGSVRSPMTTTTTPTATSFTESKLHQTSSAPVLRAAAMLYEQKMNGVAPLLDDSSPLMGKPDAEFPTIRDDVTADSSESENCNDVICPCDVHTGRQLLDAVFPMSVDQMFILLFTDSPWFHQYSESVKHSGYAASPWIIDKSGAKIRTVTYTMALNHPMAPKFTIVTEKQTCIQFGRQGHGFTVTKETQNAGVPYADSFLVHCRYCITRTAPGECRVRVHGGIAYTKNVWGIVKGFIEKNTYAGLEDHYTALEATLKQECGRLGLLGKKAAVSHDDTTLTAATANRMHKNLQAAMSSFNSPYLRSSSTDSGEMRDSRGTTIARLSSNSVVNKSASLSRRERHNVEALLASSSSANATKTSQQNPLLVVYAKVVVALLCVILLLLLAVFAKVWSIQQQPPTGSPICSIAQQLLDVQQRSGIPLDIDAVMKMYKIERYHDALDSLKATIQQLQSIERHFSEFANSGLEQNTVTLGTARHDEH